jgi:hypothetical protein
MDLKKQILVALGLDKGEDVSLGFQAKTEDGTIIVSTAEELEAGVDVSVLTEDGTTILLPVGTYKLDTGVTFRVEEEGIVAEVIESETEEEETTEEVEEVEAAEDDDKEADVADWKGMEERIQNLEDAVASLKEDKVEASDEIEEMEVEETRGTTPKSIKTTEVVEFSIEELKAENDKLKAELAEAPASAPLDTNKFSSERQVMSKKDYNRMTRKEKFLHDLNK